MNEAYFQTCWMVLKRDRPDLWAQMTKIEIETIGLISKENESTDSKPDRPETVL